MASAAAVPSGPAKLTEAQVQDLLEFALADGGLAIARADYQNPLVADAPTAIFEINADGATKKVSVVALGMDDQQPGPDTAIKTSLAKLGERLARLRSRRLAVERGLRARGLPRGPDRRQRRRRRPGPPVALAVDDAWTTSPFPADPSALRQGTRVDDAGSSRRRSGSTASRTASAVRGLRHAGPTASRTRWLGRAPRRAASETGLAPTSAHVREALAGVVHEPRLAPS